MASAFHFADGSSAHTEQELLGLLEEKDEGLTSPHVARQDYANWVRHALGNSVLADRLEKCRSVQQVIDVLRLEQVPKRKAVAPQEVSEESSPRSLPPKKPSPLDQAAAHEKSLERKPIHDLHKPSEAAKREQELATNSQEHPPTPHEHAQEVSARKEGVRVPEALPHQSLSERYNAREFLMGFIAGVVLTVIIYGIMGALA